jgi:hypothetical protein
MQFVRSTVSAMGLLSVKGPTTVQRVFSIAQGSDLRYRPEPECTTSGAVRGYSV